jgi:hypothetical protein
MLKISMKILILIMVSLLTTHSFARSIFNFADQEYVFENNDPVEIFIIGEGDELAHSFVESAVTRARKHKQVFPDRKQLLIWTTEHGSEEDRQYLEERNLKPILIDEKQLPVLDLLNALSKIKNIHSLHFFGHHSAVYGAALQSGEQKLNFIDRHDPWQKKHPEYEQKWREVLRNLTESAYIYLHGCNTGFITAVKMSQQFNIPVFGSLSATAFQNLFEDGKWYHRHPGQFPDEGSWASVNRTSFDEKEVCWKGYCSRLKPEVYPYYGYWGDYDTGLPFYKAFCAYDKSYTKDVDRCYRAMIETIWTWPSTIKDSHLSYEGFVDSLKDFLCPLNTKDEFSYINENCMQMLTDIQEGRTPFLFGERMFHGNTTFCSLDGCEYDWQLEHVGDEDTPTYIFMSEDYGNEPFAREFELYLKAYEQLFL